MLIGCKGQYKLPINNNIPVILYRETEEAGKDFWSLGYEEIKDTSDFSAIILLCKKDIQKNMTLQTVFKNNKSGIIYILFEGTVTNDLLIAYAYDSKKKIILFKFRIPLA